MALPLMLALNGLSVQKLAIKCGYVLAIRILQTLKKE